MSCIKDPKGSKYKLKSKFWYWQGIWKSLAKYLRVRGGRPFIDGFRYYTISEGPRVIGLPICWMCSDWGFWIVFTDVFCYHFLAPCKMKGRKIMDCLTMMVVEIIIDIKVFNLWGPLGSHCQSRNNTQNRKFIFMKDNDFCGDTK